MSKSRVHIPRFYVKKNKQRIFGILMINSFTVVDGVDGVDDAIFRTESHAKLWSELRNGESYVVGIDMNLEEGDQDGH